MRVPPRILVGAACVAVLLGGSLLAANGWRTRSTGAATAPGPAGPTGHAAPPTCGPWGCEQEKRFAAADAFVKRQPGYLGIVVRDRQTGAVWRDGTTTHPTWTASTIKLAMATSLLERDRAGDIELDATARRQIDDMLAFSSNDAADALWHRYGRADMVTRFQRTYGMTHLTFVKGFDRYWGLMKCTAEDLAVLMSYILDTLDSTDKGYLLTAMRAVDPIQRWGAWAAGTDLRPGVKGGWSVEKDPGGEHWVTNTVGFAGDDARYVIAAMYHLPPGTGTIAQGVHAVSDLVATVFGQPTPAPAVVPDRD
ncbi:hypothetical protein GCM10009682_05680 [Luedemannella flava]|uniref:Beta-lactamase class A catalytic domain-containing protein n=1 Tax=Luedemannella flava TaxID=349316 RepID=A0ABN2LEY4_9ACTN